MAPVRKSHRKKYTGDHSVGDVAMDLCSLPIDLL